jgi:predicted RNase H-like HicB family nuclease
VAGCDSYRRRKSWPAHGPPLLSGDRPEYVVAISDEFHMSILFERGDDGFIVAWVPEVPAALSQGRTREEARANVGDALRLVLSPEPRVHGQQER